MNKRWPIPDFHVQHTTHFLQQGSGIPGTNGGIMEWAPISNVKALIGMTPKALDLIAYFESREKRKLRIGEEK